MPAHVVQRNDEDGVLIVEVEWFTPLPAVAVPVLTQEQRDAFTRLATCRVYPEPES